MELNREQIESKAKTIIEEVNNQIKKVEETAFNKEWLQKNVNLNQLKEKVNINQIKEKINTDSKEAYNKSISWLDENYSSMLDYLGLASKDEVDTLRKKLSSLQRKVQKLTKSTKN